MAGVTAVLAGADSTAGNTEKAVAATKAILRPILIGFLLEPTADGRKVDTAPACTGGAKAAKMHSEIVRLFSSPFRGDFLSNRTECAEGAKRPR
jgi:hypothetical protein